jgi:acetyl-CoA synthetase
MILPFSTNLTSRPMSIRLGQYDPLYQDFRWKVPKVFNIGQACAPRTTREGGLTALTIDSLNGESVSLNYAQLWKASQKLANVLIALGIERGDRVAIIMAQRAETAIAHLATYIVGAVAMPMSILFGPDALAFRLEDSQAKIAIGDEDSIANLTFALTQTPSCAVALRHLIVAGDVSSLNSIHHVKQHSWLALMSKAKAEFAPVQTLAQEAAVLIYTSGTTGPPKGALIPHQALIGNLTGFVASQNWFPQDKDVLWSPADWAWTGGLMDALLPSLYFKKPIIGYRGRFSAEMAYGLLEKHQVTNTFLFPTALKQMMKAEADPRSHYKLKIRAIMSAGESVGETLFDWCNDGLGVTVNEMFGQTEVNYIVGNSAQKWPAKAGSIGKAYPGHKVAVIDEQGRQLPVGELGEIAVNRFDIHGAPDPVFFLGYWNNPKATTQKYSGDWCRTGDLATVDADGYLWYGGRADDMFKAAGYRIGPGEVENCLLKHPAVANAAVVPKPDQARGNIVKAFVVLASGQQPSEALAAELQAHVRGKLAPYEYPKEIEFIDALPMTTTGKVQRRVLRLAEAEKSTLTVK